MWIRKLRKNSLLPEIHILERLPEETTQAVLNETEIWWIAYGKALGWPLTNVSPGGGICEHTEATIEVLRQKAIARGRPPQHVMDALALGRAAHIVDDEQKKKLRDARTARKEELGYINSPETRAKLSASKKGKFPTVPYGPHQVVHGSQTAYGKWACRCDVCCAGFSARHALKPKKQGPRKYSGRPGECGTLVVMKLLGVTCKQTVWFHDPVLKPTRVNGRRVYDLDVVRAFVEKRKAQSKLG